MADPVDTPIGTLTVAHFQPQGVRHQVVVGPKFLYALFNPQDRMYTVSRAFMDFVRDGDLPYRRLLLNGHIVDEAATRLRKRASIRNAEKFLTTLEESDLYRLEFVSEAAFHAAMNRFIEWIDLDASFTDFVIAAYMREIDVDHIVTYDSNFQAFDVTTLPYRG